MPKYLTEATQEKRDSSGFTVETYEDGKGEAIKHY